MMSVGRFALAARRHHPRAMVECEALAMAHGQGILRRSKPMQTTLLASIGIGAKLYAIAKGCYEEGTCC